MAKAGRPEEGLTGRSLDPSSAIWLQPWSWGLSAGKGGTGGGFCVGRVSGIALKTWHFHLCLPDEWAWAGVPELRATYCTPGSALGASRKSLRGLVPEEGLCQDTWSSGSTAAGEILSAARGKNCSRFEGEKTDAQRSSSSQKESGLTVSLPRVCTESLT